MRSLVTENAGFVRLLLDNACAASEDQHGVKTFYIETHCVGWWITASLDKSEGWNDWTIHSMESVKV